MKNTEVLKMIKESKIEELIQKLEEEIRFEPIASKGKTNSIKAMTKLIKEGSKLRPTLGKCVFIEGFQYFTNSFIALKCVEEDYNPLLEQATEKDNYPNIRNVFPKQYDSSIELSYDELKQRIKEAKLSNEKDDKRVKIEEHRFVDYNFLEKIIDYMFYKGDKIKIEYDTQRAYIPIKITKENGTEAIIMPIREIKESE